MKFKHHCREYAYHYRDQLDKESYFLLSQAITYRLCYVPAFKRAETYHFFVGSMIKKEINTKPLIQVLLKSGRTVFVPKVTKEQQLSTHKIHTLLDLKAGAYGIEEPVTFENHCSDFDCMVLPMLAADLKGNRVGYGKGYYDKWLNSVKGYKIGVVYDACVFDEIESETHDIKMDLIVTEKRIVDVQTGNITVL